MAGVGLGFEFGDPGCFLSCQVLGCDLRLEPGTPDCLFIGHPFCCKLGFSLRPPHEFLIGQSFGLDLCLKGFLSLLGPLLFLHFIELSLRICSAIGLLSSCLLRLDLRLQESPSFGCYFQGVLGCQLLLVLEPAPFF